MTPKPTHALRDIYKPIGVAEWKTKLIRSLQKELMSSLPIIKQIEAELGVIGDQKARKK